MLNCLDRPVIELKGIGPSREKNLAEAGIRTFKDILLCLPRRFKVRPAPGPMSALAVGASHAASGVVKRSRVSGRGRRRHLRVLVEEEGCQVELVLFNRAYLKTSMKAGRGITFQGKVTEKDGLLQLLSPDYHLEGDPGAGFPGLIPVYTLPPGLFPRTFHRLVDEILNVMEDPGLPDWRTAPELRDRLPDRGLMPLEEAIRVIHRPATVEEADSARRRLAYEEFFAFQLGLALKRAKERRAAKKKGDTLSLSKSLFELDARYRTCLPFELTGAQTRAVEEIKNDLTGPFPMHRLLQGDVGSGKTAVALYLLLAAARSGGQAAFMAPTEVLAGQHQRVLTALLDPAGMKPVLLQAGLPAKQVRSLLDDPATSVVVGTHALIQERVAFRELKACVIDEQHKFGVRQRWNLKAKGAEPHVLVMTATPIPRSLALTLYGELDVTVLDELPPGRQPITTRAVSGLEDEELTAWLDHEIETGGRAFFVCPLVNESEKLDLEAAVRLHKKLKVRYAGRCDPALLHGAMAALKKTAILDDFRVGRAPFLVTTVVVEVGVDVPEASTVVILDAWRFGLAQLHQIRGRVGRGDRPSRCYLVGEPNTDTGRERIRIITGTTDGFLIAEEDLKMRGPGEALGLRQHGLPSLLAGDYVADVDLMTAARDDARCFVDTGAKPRAAGFLFPVHAGEGTLIG